MSVEDKMKQNEKFSPKTLLLKVLPIFVFVAATASVFFGYSVKLNAGGEKLLLGQISEKTENLADRAESVLGEIEQRADVAIDLMQKGKITKEDAIQSVAIDTNIQNAAVVDINGVGMDIYGNEIDLRDVGFTEISSKLEPTYLSGNDGMLYILKPLVADDALSGAFTIIFDTARLDLLFEDFDYEKDDWLILLDYNKNIIYSYQAGDRDYLQAGSDFTDTLNASKGKSVSVINGIAKRRNGNATVTIEGEKRVLSYNCMGKGGWTIITGVSRDYIVKELHTFKRTVVLLFVSLLGCMALFLGIVIMDTIMYRTAGKKKRAGLQRLAETDQLTGLYNKVTTERRIKEFIEENPDTQSLLFVLDIDNFKKINDTMGHAFGDEVLREIGQGLKGQFRASDIIGRAGGDEFILLIKNLKTDDLLVKEAHKLENFFNGLQVGTYTKYSVTASIGCAVFYRDGDSFESLYKKADEALYNAKHRGKNQLAFFENPEGFGQNV